MVVSKRIALTLLLLAGGLCAQEIRYEPSGQSPFRVPYGIGIDPDLQREVEKINLLLSKRNIKAAKPLLAGLVEKQPQLWNAYPILNRIYAMDGEFAKVLALGDRLVTLRPDVNAGHIMRGDALFQLNRYHEAIEAYEAAQQVNPADPRPVNGISFTLALSGQVNEAIDAYVKALEHDPEQVSYLQALGRLKRGQGQIDEAIKYFKKALRTDPAFVEAHVRLAACYAAKGNLPQAFKHGEEAVKQDPDRASTRNMLGFLYMRRGDHKRARPHFEAAVKLNQNHYLARRNLGIINLHQRLNDPAIEHIKAATDLQPRAVSTLNLLGILYLRTSQLDQAQETYEKALELDPENALAYFQLATIHFSKRDIKTAVKIYRQGIECHPEHVQMLNNLAWILATDENEDIRNPPEALPLILEACRVTGWRAPGTMDTLATTYSALGWHEEALFFGTEALLRAQAGRREAMVLLIGRNLEKLERAARRAELFLE